jgi:hypothetical protein
MLLRERDSSGTTERTRAKPEVREGDGANSPTQATKKAPPHHRCEAVLFLCAKRLARRNFAAQNSIKN